MTACCAVAAQVSLGPAAAGAEKPKVQGFRRRQEGPVTVTCSNGLQGTVVQDAVAYVKGKSFKGSEATSLSQYTISGTFASPTTLKGTFESSQSPFGYTCSTGTQTFSAKWTP